MKKTLSFIAAAVIAAAAGGYFYFSKMNNSAVIPPENILPQDTVAFVQISDLEEKSEMLSRSRFGENIRKIDVDKLIEASRAGSRTAQDIKKIREFASSEVNQKLFMNFFGKDFSLAFIPADLKPSSLIPKVWDSFGGFVCLAAPKAGADISGAMISAFPDIKLLGKKEHNGVEITEYEYGTNLKFYMASFKGYLITSFSDKTIGYIIDSAGRGNVLAASDRFLLLKEKLGEDNRDSFFFLDVDRMYSLLDNIALKYGSKKKLFSNIQLEKLQYLGAKGYFASDDRYESVTIGKLKGEEEVKGEDPESFYSMIPDDSAMVMWQNNLDLKKILESVVDSKEKIREFESKLVFEYGIGKKEFYDSFKGELGVLINGVKDGGMFPVPLVSLILNEKAGATFEKILDAMAKNSSRPLPMDKKYFHDTEIKYINLPFGGDIKPAWTVFENRFIFSVNPSLIEKMIIAKQEGKNILTTENYKFVSRDFPENSNFLNFIDMDRTSDAMIAGSKGFVKVVKMRNPSTAENMSVFIDGLFVPVAEALKVYQAWGQSSVYNGDILYVKSAVKINK